MHQAHTERDVPRLGRRARDERKFEGRRRFMLLPDLYRRRVLYARCQMRRQATGLLLRDAERSGRPAATVVPGTRPLKVFLCPSVAPKATGARWATAGVVLKGAGTCVCAGTSGHPDGALDTGSAKGTICC